MKNQNKIYLPLKDQGIKKAWDKAVIVRSTATNNLQMVVYWQNKPFGTWVVNNDLEKKDIELSLYCMLDYYEGCNIEERKHCKISASVFLGRFAGEKIKTFIRGDIVPRLH